MEAKEVRSLMEAYASVYEGYGKKKKGDCVSKSEKGDHNCAKKVCSEQWGEGETIFGQHAVPDENGFVSHYDVQFEHGIVEDVSVEDMDILTMESHNEHVEHEDDTISEGETPMGQHPGKSTDKATRDKYKTQSRRAIAPKGVGVPPKSDGYVGLKDDVDLFDIIKGHLIDEGFADTEEAALAIMVNMSEGWKESITESLSDVLPKSKITVPGKYGKNTVLSKKGGKPPFPGARGNAGGVEGVSDKSKPGSFTPIPGGFTPAQSTRYNQRGGQ